jgi:hypothetical protein
MAIDALRAPAATGAGSVRPTARTARRWLRAAIRRLLKAWGMSEGLGFRVVRNFQEVVVWIAEIDGTDGADRSGTRNRAVENDDALPTEVRNGEDQMV